MLESRPEPAPLSSGVAEAAHDVVVDDARRLQVRVDDRGADEREAALLQVLADRSRRAASTPGGRPSPVRGVAQRLAVDPVPEIASKLPCSACSSRNARAFLRTREDLEPVAHDARVVQPLARARRRVMAATRSGSKPRNALPVVLALAQDRDPREAGLRAFEAEQLEERAVVVQRDAPLVVVVGRVERIAAARPTRSGRALPPVARARHAGVVAAGRARLRACGCRIRHRCSAAAGRSSSRRSSSAGSRSASRSTTAAASAASA